MRTTHLTSITLLFLAHVHASSALALPPSPVDSSTLSHKVLCGYQGWFRTPDDSAKEGWTHWSRKRTISPDSLTFEMWPDLTEFGDDEKFAVPGFTYPDGKQAHLYSAVTPKTVQRHFDWMQTYGIDGVFLQRFLVNAKRPSTATVMQNVRDSAARTGRTYAICYDLSGMPAEKVADTLIDDWKHLVDDAKVTADARYLRHNGKPVLFVWGFYSDRFSADVANRMIDFLKGDSKYAVTLVGGCQWYWRTEKDADWAKVFRRLDVISPWNVGNVSKVGGKKFAATGYWKDDLAEARKAGSAYLPVIYPGFAWQNLKGKEAAKNEIPRLGGEVFWKQFSAAAELGVDMAYVAMFDEVDEGTAIYKVSNTPPTQAHFATYDGLPSDWYLRLTGEGTKLIRGERKNTAELPIKP